MPTPSPARMHDFEVVSNVPIAPMPTEIYALTIRAPKLAQTIRPGQFVNIAVPGNAMSLLRIPLSIAASDPEQGLVEIWYAVVGEGTRRLSEMGSGASSDLLGPGGKGWTVPEGCKRALLVAGGIGVPPVLCLARQELFPRGIEFDVCVGAATSSALVGIDEFCSVGAGDVRICTDDGSEGYHGFCTDPASELLSSKAYDYVATCGPEPMMAKVAAAAAAAGVACEASLERMMSCGFGACSTCAVETTSGMKGACMCGPVFDAKEVVW